MQAGGRTLTVTISGHTDECDDNEEEPNCEPLDRYIAIDLRGYEGKLTRTDSLLHREVQALLDAFSNDMKKSGTQTNFTLRVSIQGNNPFLAFYLRDVPVNRVDNFELRVNANEFGNDVTVTVRSNLITVAAHSASALVGSARRYLATPAIANLN